MAYLRCPSCSWRQDDFWSPAYNPVRMLLEMEQLLLNRDLNMVLDTGKPTSDKTGSSTLRDVLTDRLWETIRVIQNMRWKTFLDWEKKGRPGCPRCDSVLEVMS